MLAWAGAKRLRMGPGCNSVRNFRSPLGPLHFWPPRPSWATGKCQMRRPGPGQKCVCGSRVQPGTNYLFRFWPLALPTRWATPGPLEK
eukprot:3610886-Alexandrium_andersonii.AAC.1